MKRFILLFLLLLLMSTYIKANDIAKDTVWTKYGTNYGIVKFSTDSKKIISCCGNYIRIIDVETSDIDKEIYDVNLIGIYLCVSKGGKYIAVDGLNGIHLYEAGTWKYIKNIGNDQRGNFDISPDEKTIIRAEGEVARIYDIETGEVIKTIDYELPVVNILFVKYSPDGNKICLITSQLSVNEEITYLRMLKTKDYETVYNEYTIEDKPIEFSNNSKMLALKRCTNNVNFSFVIYDTETMKIIKGFQGDFAEAKNVCFTQDDKYLITNSGGQININDIETQEIIYHFNYGTYHEFDISPDNRLIAGNAVDEFLVLNKTPWYSSVNENKDLISNVELIPNPVQQNINLSFNILQDSFYKIYLTDVNGKEIEQIESKYLYIGEYKYLIDTKDIPAGIYFIVFKSNDTVQTIKFVKQ